MALTLVSAPTSEPITLEEAKSHLRVDDDDEDELISTLFKAAREWVESFTHRALITQTWDLALDGFPGWSSTGLDDNAIWLPKAPGASVTSVTYVDMAGATQTWSSALYTTDIPTGPTARRARIMPAYQQIYPVTRWGVPNVVTVRFVAGYGGASSVPSAIKAAMKLLIGHWYSNREAVLVGTRAAAVDIPMGLEALLWPYKAF